MSARDRLVRITPERHRVAKIFKNHIERAIDELGPGYIVDLQGRFDSTPIRITVEITSKKKRPEPPTKEGELLV
jgi:hypothetical protein